MVNFIKTSIPTTNDFQQVKEMPNGKYLIRLECEQLEDGTTQCYECMSDTDDVEIVSQHLQEWKAERVRRKTHRENSSRMAEIQVELAATDYLALKAFEGEDMSEHEGWRERRAALREEYRQLETANLALSVTPQQ